MNQNNVLIFLFANWTRNMENVWVVDGGLFSTLLLFFFQLLVLLGSSS